MPKPFPEWMRNIFRKGLALHEAGRSGDGLQPETVAWARRLANGEAPSPDKIVKAVAWFARHKVDKRPGWDDEGKETPGYVAYLLWGDDGDGRGEAQWIKQRDQLEEDRAMAQQQQRAFAWKVGASRELPLIERNTWDGAAAQRRIFDLAGFDSDNPNVAIARSAHLIYDDANPTNRTAYKLPFADVVDGEVVAISTGLRAAASRLPQTDAPQAVLDRAKAILDAYRERAMGMDIEIEIEVNKGEGESEDEGEMPEGGEDAMPEATPDDIEEMGKKPKRAMMRMGILSAVAYQDPAQGQPPRPIHALRTGTFTDMNGRKSTFEPKHLRQMAQSMNDAARKPPINEGHDFGRAVGRMMRAYTKNRDRDLYVDPSWNSEGERLLREKMYDAFSIELELVDDGYQIIGGALTNYPAVRGLETVSLSLPLPVDIDPIEKETVIMAEFEAPPIPVVDDPNVRSMLQTYQQQMSERMTEQFRLQYQQAIDAAQREAALQYQRWQAEQQRDQAISAFADRVTTPTMSRPYALPASRDQIVDILRSIGDEPRAKLEAMLDSILASGLVSFQSVGSAAGGEDASNATALFDNLVFAKVQQGMSKAAAIMAVSKERPDLYAAQTARKAGK